MSILERDNEWGPASPDELAQLESATGWKLPPSYRAFLLASNGGSPKKRSSFVYRAGDDEPLCDIQLFFGKLTDGPDYADIESNLQDYVGRIPDDMLPIATDSFGNLLLLDVKARPGTGAVYFWDHELEGAPDSVCAKVAESFDSLLSQLGSWTVPGDPEWLKAIELDEGDKVIRMLDEGLNPGVRYDGRSIVEYAAIHAQNDLIESLVDRGAALGDALLLAEQNAEFFPRHIETVALLRRLTPA